MLLEVRIGVRSSERVNQELTVVCLLFQFKFCCSRQVAGLTPSFTTHHLNHICFFRILNAFAEEAATEDAIYYMGEALRRGVIDLDVFLKQVRTLSRKQFILRALMHKCRQKAGLVG